MTGEIRFLGDLQRLELKPGDRFVLHVANPLSKAHADAIQEVWREWIGPEDAERFPLLILDNGLRLGAINSARPVESEGVPDIPLRLVCLTCGQRASGCVCGEGAA